MPYIKLVVLKVGSRDHQRKFGKHCFRLFNSTSISGTPGFVYKSFRCHLYTLSTVTHKRVPLDPNYNIIQLGTPLAHFGILVKDELGSRKQLGTPWNSLKHYAAQRSKYALHCYIPFAISIYNTADRIKK